MENISYEKLSGILFTDAEKASDPEFTELFSKFAFDEVPQNVSLPATEVYLGVLASLMGCQGLEVFKRVATALISGPLKEIGLKPVQMRELVYQGAAYLGIGRTLPFLDALENVFKQAGLSLSIVKTGVVRPETRQSQGSEKQMEIFGPQMKDFAQSGPEDSRHINVWLVDNCFGDYYTRRGLTVKQREMVTFCFLTGQGGCEAQLEGHIAGNFKVGNNGEYLIAILSACVPYIGYPRTLNALRCVHEALSKGEQE